MISAPWTQARENRDVTTVIFNNGAYDIRGSSCSGYAENAERLGRSGARDLPRILAVPQSIS